LKNNKRFLKGLFIHTLILALVLVLTACGKDAPKEDDAPKELNTKLTDELTLDLSYAGKVYQNDRIGKVELVKCTDGDTADFKSNGETISVRFLDVDTPETKGELEPWGKAASDFTCDKLTNANEIVLEGRTNLTETYGRYLAYIWYDGRLLNLELVEMAYSKADSYSDERYGALFQEAEMKARETKKHVYGETDPNYHYGRQTVSLEHLRKNIADYMGKNVEVTGVVTARLGGNAFLENDGYGIYLYLNHQTTTRLTVGNLVTVQGTVSEYNGAAQLIGVTRASVDVIEEEQFDLIVPQEVVVDDITADHVGALLKLSNVEITQVRNSGDAINVTIKDSNGKTILVRIDGTVKGLFDDVTFSAGDIIDVTAPLTTFNGEYQLMLNKVEDVEFK
jgi:endonuclease YncB( thermonuclease family)/DNA/RNA endonuclease YhcR with UshA esterase domain